ncbi:MAG: PDZ domain-containing protein [Pirellulales bacterium]
MTTRSRNTTIVAVALLALITAAQAQAGNPFDNVRKVINHVEHAVGGGSNQILPYPLPYPQPCPTPNPYPQPQPQPWPVPEPQPQPQPVPASYFLGVYTSTVPVGQGGAVASGPQVRVVPGYEQQVYGQRVNNIVPNSPAFHAGLEPGDVIINANGYSMDSDQHLRAAIADSQGYLEMQILDSRSGQIVLVVAEPEAQTPAAYAVNPAQPQTGGTIQPASQPQVLQSSGRQTLGTQTLQGTGGRRPPVRRR